MGGAVSKGGALVLLFGFVCVSIIVSLLSLLYFISIANFWWLVKGFERKRWESWVFYVLERWEERAYILLGLGGG